MRKTYLYSVLENVVMPCDNQPDLQHYKFGACMVEVLKIKMEVIDNPFSYKSDSFIRCYSV